MGALDGILVIAIEQAVAAPLCTVRLADAGARVIKIERQGGETARHYDGVVDGTSSYFAWLNRGKESAVLDLKAEGDLALLRRMLARADILVQNLAPGAMARMGLSNDVLERDFPQLIAVSILGYGQDTDYAQMKAYDLLVQAESGICAVTGTPDTPSKVGVPVADVGTGGAAHAAVLEALIGRGKTGRGACIEVSMFDAMADWMAVPLLHQDWEGQDVGRHGLSHAAIYPYRPFSCSDGAILFAVQTDREWDKLCRLVLNSPELLIPAYATNTQRIAARSTLDALIEPIFGQLSCAQAIAKLDAAGMAWARYRDTAELTTHPALRCVTVPLEGGKHARIPRPSGRNDGFEARALPALGQHSDAIRREFS